MNLLNDQPFFSLFNLQIKPGNLLVNSNCLLKICDFGLARVDEPNQMRHMTQEVVTQYYRAPELLMGSKHYSYAIDMWSVGCIFAELLGRRILFQAQTPIMQLELIIDMLGTPSSDDMKYACDGAKAHISRRPFRSPNPISFASLSNTATMEDVHLLRQMLTFNPVSSSSSQFACDYDYSLIL